MCIHDEIDEFIASGDYDIAYELLREIEDTLHDDWPHWKKVFWGKIPSTREERLAAREIWIESFKT